MKILALDTSTSACSAAFWSDGVLQGDQFAEMARGQSEHLVPMIRSVLRDCSVTMQDMDMIAVSTGPGAFTGVRIGLATARGLALASGLPLRGVTSLEAVAHGVPADERPDGGKGRGVLALIDSKRDDVFTQLFDADLSPMSEPQALSPDDVIRYCQKYNLEVTLAGDAAERMMDHGLSGAGVHARPSSSRHPQAAVIAAVASGRGLPTPDDASPAPLYLRPPDVKVRADGGRLRP
ncbi:MAG: tRNA (adenosine(37)-N6)-threonylcarbamoyltransferase complex dimerization subunit type 1 TsaB [Rhodospirillales bacterium]|nr:tRNA (adenosine(37)-N6)-threonylcarbamoyltransferase complex dimerization subunit type 1 TsaB [Rhodospirillales bacterium]MBT4038504.1 tRNA (adenosine(37)-N6)-threonylcarbamoyltransferase complex dimerization subunit type 1 TsaB [Rhodospirillales bacterium]MBT4625416.1 tRNA (adenosine(37)-N6)-threonylcarbamoyltransferase complex dimerization subunit type 1 TsaB [Rhodospirillales bacterium]MBT5352054.1 tRNA (adenosine(37)-N6)-threonylcarbamoyltransferase complex dimerization subunit type 1 Tsa